MINETKEMAEWGVDFAKPKINIDAVRARKEKVIATLTGGLKQLAKKRKIEVITARGYFENSNTLRLDYADGKAERPLDLRTLRAGQRLAAGDSRPVQAADRSGDGFDRRAGAEGRARVAAGDRRRLHRPGDGHRSTPSWARR